MQLLAKELQQNNPPAKYYLTQNQNTKVSSLISSCIILYHFKNQPKIEFVMIRPKLNLDFSPS